MVRFEGERWIASFGRLVWGEGGGPDAWLARSAGLHGCPEMAVLTGDETQWSKWVDNEFLDGSNGGLLMATDKSQENGRRAKRGEQSAEAGTGPAGGPFFHLDSSRVKKMWQTPIDVYLARTLEAAREKNRLAREARAAAGAAGAAGAGEDDEAPEAPAGEDEGA